MIQEIIPPGFRPKHKKLIETAYLLFQRHGFQRVSVEEICRRAQVSKVTFYKYFSSKDELIVFITRLIFEALYAEIRKVLKSDQGIKVIFDRASIIKQEYIGKMGEELLMGIMSFPAAREYLDDVSKRSWMEFREYVINEQRKGNINPRIDIDYILPILSEINKLFNVEGLKNLYKKPDLLITQINELIVNGLLARKED